MLHTINSLQISSSRDLTDVILVIEDVAHNSLQMLSSGDFTGVMMMMMMMMMMMILSYPLKGQSGPLVD